MTELIHTTTGFKMGFDRSIFCKLGIGGTMERGASQYLYRATNLTLPAIDELIHNTNGLKMGCERSRLYDVGNGGRSKEKIMTATIIDVSRISLFYSLTMVM